MLKISYLTLGGWDDRDLLGDMHWFSTQRSEGSWNLTIYEFKVGEVSIMPQAHGSSHLKHDKKAPAMFQTGYPYIGVPSSSYDLLEDALKSYVPGMECTRGYDWGICRVESLSCSKIFLPVNLTISIENFDFIFPVQNLLTYIR